MLAIILNIVAPVFSSIVSAVVILKVTKLSKDKDELAKVQKQDVQKQVAKIDLLLHAQKAVLRYQIVQAHEYFVCKETIGKYSLSSIEDMYEKYTSLGGNSFVHSLMEEIRELKII